MTLQFARSCVAKTLIDPEAPRLLAFFICPKDLFLETSIGAVRTAPYDSLLIRLIRSSTVQSDLARSRYRHERDPLPKPSLRTRSMFSPDWLTATLAVFSTVQHSLARRSHWPGPPRDQKSPQPDLNGGPKLQRLAGGHLREVPPTGRYRGIWIRIRHP